MGFKVIWFYIIILLFIYYPFIYMGWFFILLFGFLCLGLGVFCNPFVRRLLGFSIIIGNFLLCFGSSLYLFRIGFWFGLFGLFGWIGLGSWLVVGILVLFGSVFLVSEFCTLYGNYNCILVLGRWLSILGMGIVLFVLGSRIIDLVYLVEEYT